MDRERTQELLPVIQAFADGEDIQVIHHIDKNPEWQTTQYFDPASLCEWRIKPKEPLEGYVLPRDLHTHAPNGECTISGCIKVREVMD